MQEFKIYQSLIDHATANGLFKKAEQLIQVQQSMLKLQADYEALKSQLQKEKESKNANIGRDIVAAD
jgi:hypothetical protein